MNHCWMSAIARSANSVEKMQVFWPWSSLRMSACTVPRTFASAQAPRSAAPAAAAARRDVGGEEAGVRALVLLEDVRLHGPADVRQRPGPQLGRLGGVRLAAL